MKRSDQIPFGKHKGLQFSSLSEKYRLDILRNKKWRNKLTKKQIQYIMKSLCIPFHYTHHLSYIPTLKRHHILRKTNYKCGYCGVNLTIENNVFDHIIPKAHDGPNNENNLMAACRKCNSIKRTKTLEEFRLYQSCPQAVAEARFSYKQLKWLKNKGLFEEIGGIPNFEFYFETLKNIRRTRDGKDKTFKESQYSRCNQPIHYKGIHPSAKQIITESRTLL